MGAVRENKTELFETMPIPKAVWTMVLPAVISQLIVLIYNMADTFFIGSTDDPYMVAGVSLILPLFNITVALAGLTGVGGGSYPGCWGGRNRTKRDGYTASAFFWLSPSPRCFHWQHWFSCVP